MPDSTPLMPDLKVSTPLARVRAVHAYALLVFGDESRAATWMSRAQKSVGGGLCAVGAACQDAEGYRQAVGELSRLEQLARESAPHAIAA